MSQMIFRGQKEDKTLLERSLLWIVKLGEEDSLDQRNI